MLTTFTSSRIHDVGRLFAGLAILTTTGWAANVGNTLNITTGTTITRGWDTIVSQGYVYGAKQSYSVAGTSTSTRIYLPYGDVNSAYYTADTLAFTNAGVSQKAVAASVNGGNDCNLTFKFHFDQAISAFAAHANWSQWDLVSSGTDTIAGAAQYSVDGTTWTNMWSATSPASGVAEPLLANYPVTGLATSDLYLRFATYNQTNPASTSGGSRYMALEQAGRGDWGPDDFWARQMQLEVTTVPEPAALSLLAMGGCFLMRRRLRRG